LVGWVTPTKTANAAYGGRLQHLRLLVAASRLGSSTKLSYRPQLNSSGIKLIYMFRGSAMPLGLFTTLSQRAPQIIAKASMVQKMKSNILTDSEAISLNIPNFSQLKEKS
jgi:hypothetical protein